MKMRTFAAVFAITIFLFAAPASARPEGMCNFRCNVEGFDFCIRTGEPNYACWEITGGCISGGSPCGGPGW